MSAQPTNGHGFWLEFIGFSVIAVGLTLGSEPVLIGALSLAYGTPGAAPAALLANLSLVSPVFPLLLGLIAFVRFKLARISMRSVVLGNGEALWRDARLGLVVGAISLAMVFAALGLMSRLAPLPPYAAMPWQHHLYFATIGALVPAVCEELYFRGLLLRATGLASRAIALLLSAAVFAAWHIGAPAYLLHTFVLGLVWGALFLRSGRLIAPIIAHFVGNAGFGLLLLAGFMPG